MTYVDRVKEQARGRWRGILAHYGLDEKALSGRNCACPICGNTSQGGFRLMDRNGDGTFFCSRCNENGAADGLSMVMKIRGIDFKAAVADVGGLLHTTDIEQSQERKKPAVTGRALWDGGAKVSGCALQYLRSRGINITPSNHLRMHVAVPYQFEDGKGVNMPALLAAVTDPDGKLRAVHRTYITLDGKKADVPTPRKLSGSIGHGAAIRLHKMQDGVLAVAEGIETALAVRQLYGYSCWSLISAGNMEKFEFPVGLSRLCICGDNDASFTGQKAAMTLAYRARQSGIQVSVLIPNRVGSDMNDFLLAPESTKLVEW